MLDERSLAGISRILNAVPYGIVLWDRQHRFVLGNRRYLELYGIPRSRATAGATMEDLLEASKAFGGDGREGLQAARAELLRVAAGQMTIEHAVADGRTLMVSYTSLPDVGWVAVHEDVSSRHADRHQRAANEELLRLQNERFGWALDNMAQGLCMFDRDRRLVVSNRRYAELYRIPPDEVKPGQTLEEILQQRAAFGNIPVGGASSYLRARLAVHAATERRSDDVELQDGRTIQILHQTLPDGGWVATHEDITEQRAAAAKMRYLAQHDPLTGLPNRAYFREKLDSVQGLIKAGETFAVLFIDLDQFKPVNDTFGHPMGDLLLSAVGERITECAGPDTFVSRLGGDEFAILQGPPQTMLHSSLLAGSLVRRMAEPFEIEGERLAIGASVGIAVAPVDGKDSLNLMRHADLALYAAKRAGRGDYCFFGSADGGDRTALAG